MHLIINNVARDSEVDGVDHFIISIILVTVEIWRLAAVTWFDYSISS